MTTHATTTAGGAPDASKITISMVMIARDEADNIQSCFDSFWDDVDEVVLVDTGSKDTTIRTAKSYAYDRGEAEKLKVGTFEWCDDFAAARNYADSLATSDWKAWVDLDDQVVGMAHMRKLAERASPDITMLYARYEYAFDSLGHCFCELWRERLVRAGTSKWVGRVHECQIGQGTMMRVDKDDARWVHSREIVAEVRDRNELLLRGWVEEDPTDPRAVGYLAFELMGSRIEKEVEGETLTEPDKEKLAESVIYFRRYLEMSGQPPDARAQSARRYAQVLMTLGQFAEAQQESLPMLAECPWWPDTLLTLAEIAHEQRDWRRTIDFADQVLQRGEPDTMLIINPEDYSLRPRVLIASAMASLGKLEDACKMAQQVADVNPGYMGVGGQLAEWMGALARDQAGTSWANSAQLLILNDEPEKALLLLTTVPYFSNDHPAIIASRVAAANALSEPYQIEMVGDGPRGQFLARCLREQEAVGDELEGLKDVACEVEDSDEFSDEIDAELAYGRD